MHVPANQTKAYSTFTVNLPFRVRLISLQAGRPRFHPLNDWGCLVCIPAVRRDDQCPAQRRENDVTFSFRT